MDGMTLALIIGAAIAVLVVTHEAYREGKQQGWLEGADWAVREAFDGHLAPYEDVPPLSPEFVAARRGSRTTEAEDRAMWGDR